jgi:tellurite resistance protein TerC
MMFLGRLSAKGWHLTALFIWLAIGSIYNTVIYVRFGSNAGINWFAGYLLEFIFLVENIFIFHIVIDAFKTPTKLTTKALFMVVWGQIIFEMIFFMGLAAWMRSFKALPYILGVWLICCGFLAARGEHSVQIDIMQTSACRAFTSCLGDRLSHDYDEKDGGCLLRDSSGKMRVSLLGLVVFVLLSADFLLEIDVVLTKIEELPNPYIAFTSSALAAFSIPDLFFVSKGLLKRFVLLKYGIAFVLVLFGAQMLLSSIYVIRPIVACCIIVGVLTACVLISCLISCSSGAPPDDQKKSLSAEEATECKDEAAPAAQRELQMRVEEEKRRAEREAARSIAGAEAARLQNQRPQEEAKRSAEAAPSSVSCFSS